MESKKIENKDKEFFTSHKKWGLYVLWFVFIGLIEVWLLSSLFNSAISTFRYSKTGTFLIHPLAYVFILFPYFLFDYIRRKIIKGVPCVWFRLLEVGIWLAIALYCALNNYAVEWFEVFFAPLSKIFLLFLPLLLAAWGIGFVKSEVFLKRLLLLLVLLVLCALIWMLTRYLYQNPVNADYFND